MASLTFALPLSEDQIAAHDRFTGEIERRWAEHTASRKRLGVTLERAYIQRSDEGAVLVVHLEGPGVDQFDTALAQSTDAYDRWFQQQVQAIFGPMDGQAPRPERLYVLETSAPRTDGSLAVAAPIATDRVDDLRDFVREYTGARRAEYTAWLERCHVQKEEAQLLQTDDRTWFAVYMEGPASMQEAAVFDPDDRFQKWWGARMQEVSGFTAEQMAKMPEVRKVLDWSEGKRAATAAAAPMR